MLKGIYLGFDFGYRRIGVAVGQRLTMTATPLATQKALHGVPDWHAIQHLIHQWRPDALIVGLPTCIDSRELYTTKAATQFAQQLQQRFSVPVHLVDERLTTVEARAHLFAQGGYRQVKRSEVDSIAACIILEQWLSEK